MPLNGDNAGRYVPDGKAAVWRTRDGGDSWQALRAGLPQENVFFGVLRQAMATDRLDPAGVYFGTNTGALYASADEGDSWRCIARHLPLITSVETLLVEAEARARSRAMPDTLPLVAVTLPTLLVRLFPGSVRRVDLSAATVAEVIDALDARWPGMRDRLCEFEAGDPAPYQRVRRGRARDPRDATRARRRGVHHDRDQRRLTGAAAALVAAAKPRHLSWGRGSWRSGDEGSR